MTANLSFQYLYRDASNYKQHGETIFSNRGHLSLDEIEKQIRACLHDGEFFIAQQVNIPECFFDVLHEEDDHPWHEFNLVEETCDPMFDPEPPEHTRDITQFIADMQKVREVGWDELKVREDLARQIKKQMRAMRQKLESSGKV